MQALYIGGMGARGRNFYNNLAVRYGYEQEAAAIQDAYLAGRKDEAAGLIPQELLEHVSLIGPKSFVAERVAAMKESGVTTLNVAPMAADARRAHRADRADQGPGRVMAAVCVAGTAP